MIYNEIRRFRARLAAGEFLLGAGISFYDPAVTEALGPSVDFVWIDLEHCPLGMESLQAHLMAARAADSPALVRVPGEEISTLKRVLDIGAPGIIVPQVESADGVRKIVSACRYPPVGTRGYGPRRPSDYGRDAGVEYLERANQDLFVSVQIETAAALADVEAICDLPGLDCVIVGPADLSNAMGFIGQPRNPQVLKAIERIVRAARERGKFVGMGMGPDADFAKWARKAGVNWVQCGGDFSFMVGRVDDLYSEIRRG